MLHYVTGFSHATALACLAVLLWSSMDQNRKYAPAPVPRPYALVIEDDCYLPDGQRETEIMPLSISDVERLLK